MKYYFTLGGLVGFSLTFANALLAGSDPDIALRDAAIGCLIVGLLFRWLRGTVMTSITFALKERERALAETRQAQENAAPDLGAAAPALG